MLGLMMEVPLLLSRLIDYAADHHGSTEVVARRLDGTIERDNWAGMRRRAKRLGKALAAKNFPADTRIASLAWNTLDHIELFYGVLGLGIPLHTLNPRLTPDDLEYMITLAEDTVCFFDADTAPLAELVAKQTSTIKLWIMLDDGKTIPECNLPNWIRKSDLIAGVDDNFEWPEFDERSAATICFTSGTTGKPKGVVYSHRSITLCAMNMTMADMYGNASNGERVTVMPIAPIFHANGWMMPFSAPMNGHKLVLPGRDFSPPALIELLKTEHVTLAGAVPTVWNDLLLELGRTGEQLPHLRTALVAGTTIPPSLFDALEKKNIAVRQTWGMTEVPGGTRASMSPGSAELSQQQQQCVRKERQGRIGFQADLRIVDDNGSILPHDGVSSGALQVRGPTAVARYLGEPPEKAVRWLDTGDIARIYPDSTIQIIDRAKDVIKSGGEWISSPQLEAAAASHPGVYLAAAIAVPHPRWQERPLLVCTLKPGISLKPDELRTHMSALLAKWWMPDEIIFVEEIPKTHAGKINKMRLRELYGRPVD